MLQVVSRHSIGNEAEILSALNLPLGPGGSEFGGLEVGATGRYLSASLSLFVQLAWYF